MAWAYRVYLCTTLVGSLGISAIKFSRHVYLYWDLLLRVYTDKGKLLQRLHK